MKRLLVSLFMMSTLAVTAQNDYGFGIGVRGGFENGLTVKAATGEASALEGIFALRWNSFQATALWQRANDLSSSGNLNLFYGAGGHVGAYGTEYRFYPEDQADDQIINVGLDAIVGLEYTFDAIPFSVALDAKPAIDLIYPSPVYMGAGLSVRYVVE